MADIKLDHVNRFTVYNVMREAEDLQRVFDSLDTRNLNTATARRFTNEMESRIQSLWSPDNWVLQRTLQALEHTLRREGIYDLPNIYDVLREAEDRVDHLEIDGYHRDDRLYLHSEDALDRIRTRDPETEAIKRRQQQINSMEQGPQKRIAQAALDRRKEAQAYSKLKVGHYKRLMFAETMRYVQQATATYLEMAGFYFVRWNLSPTHPMGDICDVCARHVWLSDADQDEYMHMTGDSSLGGVLPVADLQGDLFIHELEDWSDSEIASAIRHYSRLRKIDTRRKRAGHFPAHPLCKCYLSPILESRM